MLRDWASILWTTPRVTRSVSAMSIVCMPSFWLACMMPGIWCSLASRMRLRTAVVATMISNLGSNIENVTVVEQDLHVCVDLITISVKDRVHLAKIMRRLKELSIVNKITRVKA